MQRPQSMAHDTPTVSATPPDAARWMRIALWLVGATMAYNAVEAGVALWAGERAESISLLGFGLDSLIELAAALALFWRLSREWAGADHEAVERSERFVLRLVGATFIGLALYVTADAGWTLWAGEAPARSLPGIALAAASLVIMPLVAWAKLRAAARLDSSALRAEAKETLACSYLSAVLLLGLGANALLGWWWMDPAAALAMVPWLLKEGREGLAGEHCDD
ncbi:MAG TPA: cation transporter [bacterium]|nr:cation transporter [bacterium]